ncbi:universal stress protein [uncultured Jatrophihabitans sp.]|uniref:universal stress protein n=1 Tax=uncultured Jatrophihabitans sp. TaxID=1610747 RepID=UPI0035CA58DD
MVDSGFELGTDGPRTMLVGIDGSHTSMRAAAYAAGMARRQGVHLIGLYVQPTTSASVQAVAATAGALIEAPEDITADLRKSFDDGVERLGLSAQFEVRSGNPYKALIAVAKEFRVDAIVIGASTQAGYKLVGSLASRLVKDAAWPVTVVP